MTEPSPPASPEPAPPPSLAPPPPEPLAPPPVPPKPATPLQEWAAAGAIILVLLGFAYMFVSMLRSARL